jgi:hypothetical protein
MLRLINKNLKYGEKKFLLKKILHPKKTIEKRTSTLYYVLGRANP